MKTRRRNAARTAAAVFGVGSLCAAGAAFANLNPLPTFAQSVEPAVMILIDRSGSMAGATGDTPGVYTLCDGGTVVPTQDLTLVSGQADYLFNPLTDQNDDGACTGRDSNMTSYPINRIEAVKLALSKILDADGNGIINTADEQILKLKIGLMVYPTNNTWDPGNAGNIAYPASTDYRTAVVAPIGSSYAEVWDRINEIVATGAATPSGPALAGARKLGLEPCYDATPGGCDLGPGQQRTDGSDIAVDCRDYYTIFLTDGSPNQGTSLVGQDPIPVARALRNKAPAGSETSTILGVAAPRIRTFAIGMGNVVNTLGSQARGSINCTAYWGSYTPANFTDADYSVTDGDKDGDGKSYTMRATPLLSPQTVHDPGDPGDLSGNHCRNDTAMMESAAAHVRGLGNGYFAADARALTETFKRIMNAIQTGVYSRSEPVVATSSTVSGRNVYGLFFEIVRGRLDWQGHLRKYQFDVDKGDYVNCNTSTVPSTADALVPCWDAGGWYGQSAPTGVEEDEGLFERSWGTRVIYGFNPGNIQYDANLTSDHVNRPLDGQAPPIATTLTLKNLIPPLVSSNLSVSGLVITSGNLPAANTDLHWWLAVSAYKAGSETYLGSDTSIPIEKLVRSVQSLTFAGGRPTAEFADGTKRCGSPTCTDSSPSPKLGDSFNSKVVVVGPPTGATTDASYVTTFRNRALGTYSGNERVVEEDGTTAVSPCRSGVALADCTVKDRRKVVYVAANDGMLHAFDEVTGRELWAFLPPMHMPKLQKQLEGRQTYIDGIPIVRDVKMPLEVGKNFADGAWRTMLILNQGTGGNFYFALDITNPVMPVFMWEMRGGDKMGLTITRAAVAGIPPKPDGTTDADKPGSMIVVTSGLTGAGQADEWVRTISPTVAKKLQERALGTSGKDLPDALTVPAGIDNKIVGHPRPASGNPFSGVADRVYFGDSEGRLWKMCGIVSDGDFDNLIMFFDPAMYDNPAGDGVGQPIKAEDPTEGLPNADDRMRLRGPIFFQPDVTYDADGNLLVAFGSGNFLDPLQAPAGYRNLVWVVKDSASNACSLPLASSCAASAGSTVIGSSSFPGTVALRDLLSGPPLIFNSFLIYPELDLDGNDDGDICDADYVSRLKAVNVFNCGVPGEGAFLDDQGNPTNEIVFEDTLVTGVQIDPASGTLFVQTSSGEQPQTLDAPNLKSASSYAGFKQK